MKLLPLLACLLTFSSTPLIYAQNADALVAEGRAFLVAQDLTNANARFASAVSIAPFNDQAKVFYAATRLLTLAEKPAGRALLDKLGFTPTNRSIYAWTATVPTDTNGLPFAPTNMSASELTGFLRTNVLAEVVGASANLATVNNHQFTLLLTAEETSTTKVTLDYGDLLLMRAMLKFAQYAIYTANSWNIDAQLETVRSFIASDNAVAEDILQQFPNLFSFATTNDLNAAQQAFSQAVSLYVEASNFIRARPTNEVRLFNYDPDTRDRELFFRTTLNELKESLNGPVVLTVDPHYPAYFGQHFSGTSAPRDFLPEVKSNAFVAGTLPDPTFGGLVQGVSRPQLEKLLGAKKHLGLPYVLRFTAPTHLPDGSILFNFPAINDSLVVIQASVDLQNWYSLETFCISNGTFSFLDNSVSASQQRYFRTVDLSQSPPTSFRPPHDRFAQRATLSGSVFSIVGASRGATSEPDEPFHAGFAGNSLWWSWTAPANGRFLLSTRGSSGRPALAVYTGNSLASLVEIASDFGSGVDRASVVVLDAIAGQTYQIAVAYDYDEEGKVVLNLHPLPPNDFFDDRLPIFGRTNTVTGFNLYATKEREGFDPFGLSEPDHAGNAGGNSLWWYWTAPETGFVTIDTFGSSFDTLLAVYLDEFGSVFYLLEVASNDDAGSDLRSRVRFLAHAETTYVIAVDGFAGANGNIVLNLRQPPPTPPANDNFVNRLVIGGTDITFSGNNLGATREPGEPRHFGSAEGHSVWWTWTAPVTGDVVITAPESSFEVVASVYAGSDVSNLSRVAEDYLAFSEFGFSTLAGATYHIAVDGDGGDNGDFVLNLTQTPGSPEPPFPFNAGSFREFFVGDSIYLDEITLLGTFPMRFQWFKDGTAIHGATNSILFIASAQLTDAGSYALHATNILGDTVSDSIPVTIYPRPPNNNFTNRFLIAGTSILVTGTNVGASKEPGEPEHAFNPGGKSVWWTWTAPSDGDVSVTISSGVFDPFYTLLGVYLGNSVSNLTLIAFGEGFGSAQVNFSTLAGATYQIAVDGEPETAGIFELSLVETAAPPQAPQISDGPFSAEVFPGQMVLFSATVSGSFPMAFQWFRNGTAVPGATSPSLFIASAQISNVGTYVLRATNAVGDAVSDEAELSLILPPANDLFANRAVLTGQVVEAFANSIRATREVGEPVHGGVPSQKSVWWTWTAPIDGFVTVDSSGSDFGTVLAVYSGNSLSALMVVATDPYSGGVVSFSTAAGATYQIAVSAVEGEPAGHVSLYLEQVAAPLEPPQIVDGPYSVAAYVGDRVDFEVLVNGSFPLTFQWFKDGVRIPGATNSNLIIPSVQAQHVGTYSLRVTNSVDFAISDAALLSVIVVPPNDAFQNRLPITGQSNTVFANNTLATRENGEPLHADEYGEHSVWWTWTAPVDGTVTFTAASSDFIYLLLAVYSGNSLANLTAVGDVSTGPFGESVVSFSTAAGETYQIAVDTYEEEFGSLSLTVNQVSEPLQAPQIEDGPYDQSVLPGNSVYFSASVTGSLPLRLQWFKDGQALVGETSAELSFDLINSNQFGVYTLQASNPVAVVTASATLSEIVPPPNDDFADRIVIPGQSNTVTANTTLATREQDEPLHNGYFGYASAWWTWTAPIDGTVTFSTAGSDFTTLLAIYTGGSVTNLTYVASGFGTTFFSSSAGATYQIAVDGYYSSGNARLSVNQITAPLQPPQIFNGPFSQTASAGSSISFSASVTGSFPFVFQWFKSGQAIAGATNLTYSIPFVQTNDAGTYLLQASNAAGTTNAQAVLTVPIPPPNDLFTNRLAILGGTNTVFGTNTLAGRENGEPNHFGYSPLKSLWWTWTAPKSGQVQIDTIGSNFDTLLAIYTGNSFPLTGVTGDDQSGGNNTSRVIFNAIGGTVYQIAVDGYFGSSGRIVLNLRQP